MITTVGRALAALALTIALAGCNLDEGSGSGSSWAEDDIEYKLAVIDAGGNVGSDDPRIDEYGKALNRLFTTQGVDGV